MSLFGLKFVSILSLKVYIFYIEFLFLHQKTTRLFDQSYQLSKYLNQPKEDILFDILKDDVDEDYSLTSLRYLCYLNTHNYTIAIKPNVPNHLRTGVMIFDGYAYKKRSGNTFTIVDSWSRIKKEHWSMLRVHFRTKLDRDSWTEVFINEDMYITNVLYF